MFGVVFWLNLSAEWGGDKLFLHAWTGEARLSNCCEDEFFHLISVGILSWKYLLQMVVAWSLWLHARQEADDP